MAGRRAGAGLALAAVALSAAGCSIGGSTKTVTSTVTRTVTTTRTVTQPSSSTAPCTGKQLSGTFAFVPGSSGAGHTEYTLTLRNRWEVACKVFGLPEAQLLSATGSPLPTQISPAGNPHASVPSITLAPGATAQANAYFSPDVPGTGDSQTGACQPKASALLVSPNGGGTVRVPITPPTSVCEQGSLSFSVFAAS